MSKKESNPPPKGVRPPIPPKPPVKSNYCNEATLHVCRDCNTPIEFGADHSCFDQQHIKRKLKPKFEYRTENLPREHGTDQLLSILNRLGHEGWELMFYEFGVLVFKRVINHGNY